MMPQGAKVQKNNHPAEGVILIDKPKGMSSFKAVKAVSRITGIKKAGHAGTLDPMATGLLVVCLGRATRITRFIMQGAKEYHGEMRLGIATDTYDALGSVTDKRDVPGNLSVEDVQKAASSLTGRLMQSPPPFSAAKHQGVPLYRLARKGEMVHKEPKEIVVYDFKVKDAGLPFLSFSVTCSKGTYIRSLCHEVGVMLGCGAHMTRLERTRCGCLDIGQAFSVEGLEEAMRQHGLGSVLMPLNEALCHIPAVPVSGSQAVRLRHGQGLAFDEFQRALESAGTLSFISHNALVRIVTESDAGEELVAVGRYCSDERGRLVTEKIFNF